MARKGKSKLPQDLTIKPNLPGTELSHIFVDEAVTLPPGALPPMDQVAVGAVHNMANKVEEAIKPSYRGLICNAYVTENMVFGNIYNDTEKEYDDGELIRTAAIVAYIQPDMVDCNNGVFKVEWTQAQLDSFAAKR